MIKRTIRVGEKDTGQMERKCVRKKISGKKR
jgi:hypothetical protein